MFYCKQMTYKQLVLQSERIFDAKRTQTKPRRGQKPPLMRPLTGVL